jgi:hypothetical protein
MPSSRATAVTVIPEESTSAIASRLNSSVYRFVYLLPTWCYFLWNLKIPVSRCPRSRGSFIKALSEYLGHSDPGFPLRTYTHLLPSSETRTRKAIDDVFAEAEAEDGDDRPGTQGTSVPPAKPMCPQCALAA